VAELHPIGTNAFELPGFQLPEAPTFSTADGASIFTGELPDIASYLDLAMVFGSRLWGHRPERLAEAASAAPGLGDLYGHELRARANRALCERVASELGEDAAQWRSLILHTGSEAVETAIKTALRASDRGRSRTAAFEGGYHGTFGLALAVTHRAAFREPWADQFASSAVQFAPWGEVPELGRDVACVIVEPWQGRAGVVPPPVGFLAQLRAACDESGALLVLDAVLCGAGRTGPTIAEGIAEARPDFICLGKAIGAGLAASAVVARTEVAAAAWDRGQVEPAHTSSLLGDPFSCVGILRALELLVTREVELRQQGRAWRASLESIARDTGLELRGIGMLWALDTGTGGAGLELAFRLRDEHRILVVPSSADARSITIYPAVSVSDLERERFGAAVRACVG